MWGLAGSTLYREWIYHWNFFSWQWLMLLFFSGRQTLAGYSFSIFICNNRSFFHIFQKSILSSAHCHCVFTFLSLLTDFGPRWHLLTPDFFLFWLELSLFWLGYSFLSFREMAEPSSCRTPRLRLRQKQSLKKVQCKTCDRGGINEQDGWTLSPGRDQAGGLFPNQVQNAEKAGVEQQLGVQHRWWNRC